MSENTIVNNLRIRLKGTHDWFEGNLIDVDDALVNDSPPGGIIARIGHYMLMGMLLKIIK